MKITKNLGLIALFLLICASLLAQKVTFGIKGGFLSSKLKLSWSEPIANEGHSETRPTYAIFMDGKLTKHFYLGVEVGTCSYVEFMNFKYTLTQFSGQLTTKTNYTYLSYYQQEQIYFALCPQLKFESIFSVGGGIGIYNNYINKFNSGFRTAYVEGSLKNELLNLEGKDLFLPNTTVGGFFNFTINPKINHIGFIVDARYILNAPSNGQITKVLPDVSFNSFAVMGGLTYNF